MSVILDPNLIMYNHATTVENQLTENPNNNH